MRLPDKFLPGAIRFGRLYGRILEAGHSLYLPRARSSIILRRPEAMLPREEKVDENTILSLIRYDLFGVVVDRAWSSARAAAKGASASFQHGQAETQRGQAHCGRYSFLS